MQILFAGGQVYNGTALCHADVLVSDGIIAQIGPAISAGEAALHVDAAGCVLAPGFTDLHVHLRQPGSSHKETIASGTAAAAAGGFTTVCAMPNVQPVPDTAQHLAIQQESLEKDALVRVLPYGAITEGQQGEQLANIEALAGLVCGFSDDGCGVQNEGLMRQAMEKVAEQSSFIAAHCEVEALIAPEAVCVQSDSAFATAHGWAGVSAESEWREVERDIALVRQTGCRLHICHASTAETFELVRSAKAEGLPVSCEATPHNLLLSCDDICEDSGRFRMNPPLRTKKDVFAAQTALQDGTIDAIATDHAPHTAKEKEGPFAQSLNGVVGLETAFAACYTGLVQPGVIPLERLLSLLSSGPQKVLRGPPPVLAPGAIANVVLLNLQHRQTVNPQTFASMGRATPFAGATLSGWPVMTLCEGRVVYRRANQQHLDA